MTDVLSADELNVLSQIADPENRPVQDVEAIDRLLAMHLVTQEGDGYGVTDSGRLVLQARADALVDQTRW